MLLRWRLLLAGIVLCLALPAVGADAYFELDVRVTIDPLRRALAGQGSLRVPAGGAEVVTLGERFRTAQFIFEGRYLHQTTSEIPGAVGWLLPASGSTREISVSWQGSLEPVDSRLQHRETLDFSLPVTGDSGTYLPAASYWYPAVTGRFLRWRVRLDLPAGQRGLVPGRLVSESEGPSGYSAQFEFALAGEGIDLFAGPYVVAERLMKTPDGREVSLRTYFFRELEDLAPGYLDSSAEYIRMFEKRIGAYPYPCFSVVASPTPTGFGMPSLTYLGADVLRLPFIRSSSLGHEVLHNWWGNGVFVDYAQGNWSEGLTTFMADYSFKELEGEAAAREARLGWMRDLSAVPPAQDMAISQFTSRTHGVSQMLGYHKTAMVLFMLREHIGPESFDKGLRSFWATHRFESAGWDDLQDAWDQASGSSLSVFFGQWLRRRGVPFVQLESARYSTGPGRSALRVTLTQDAIPWALRVPLRLHFPYGTRDISVEIAESRNEVDIPDVEHVTAVSLDPDLRLLRRLSKGEAPPILRDVMLSERTSLITLNPDPAFREEVLRLSARFLEGSTQEGAADSLPDTAAMVVGTASQVRDYLRRQLPEADQVEPDASVKGDVLVWTVRGPHGAILCIAARDSASLGALARSLPHHGKQSWLVFNRGRAVGRGVWPSVPQILKIEVSKPMVSGIWPKSSR
jgi:hypothetical protein